ncbi:MAG: helix-turn-helix domain-containing protein [Lachnospiraceae bacterium]|nr:helix-turn-helix domain-containing protein [Lachnospiraceae bacterium]
MQDFTRKEQVTHGTVLAPIQTYEFLPGEERFFVPHHWHEEVEILLVEKGEFILVRDMERLRLREGDLCFIGQGQMHQLEGIRPYSMHRAVVFDLRMLSFEIFDEEQSQVIKPLLTKEIKFPSVISSASAEGRVLRMWYEQIIEEAGKKQKGWLLACKACLLEMIAVMERRELLCEKNRKRQGALEVSLSVIKGILSYIEEHYKEKIYISELAKTANMNEQYFCRFFKKMTGNTPVEHLNRYRIEKAAELLSGTDQKIMDICLECGFEHFSYFIKKFKEYKEVTPHEYRAKLREVCQKMDSGLD